MEDPHKGDHLMPQPSDALPLWALRQPALLMTAQCLHQAAQVFTIHQQLSQAVQWSEMFTLASINATQMSHTTLAINM